MDLVSIKWEHIGIGAHVACSLNHQLIFHIYVPICHTLCLNGPLIWFLRLWSPWSYHLWADLMYMNGFWCRPQRPFMWLTAQSSQPLFGSGPRLVFEWVSSVIKIPVDGTLGLRAGIRERLATLAPFRWISHDESRWHWGAGHPEQTDRTSRRAAGLGRLAELI